MAVSTQDIDVLIAQTEALKWDDPSSQLETLPIALVKPELLPLVGLVISQKTQNNQSVNTALTKSWFFAIPFSFAALGPNTFLFKFSDKEHISRILSQVWNVNGFLLSLQQWSPTATLGELSLKEFPFWIQIHGLPLQNMTVKNAISIGKGLGELIRFEDNSGANTIFRSFLRLQVKIDVSKPLKPGFNFSRPDGSETWISLKYERLDIYCSDCGRIGHKQPSCLAPKIERFPTRYLISLKVNIFSNILPSLTTPQNPDIHEPSSSTFRNKPSKPLMESSQSQANQTNIPLTSPNPLTPNIAESTLSPDILKSALSSAAKLDFPIENTLNALSLFQRPIQIFAVAKHLETSLPIPTPSSHANYVDPSKKWISQTSQIQDSTNPLISDFLNPTAINISKTVIPPTKARNSYRNQANKSPYHTRSPKKIVLPPSEEIPSPDSITSDTPPQTKRKRPNLSEMVSPSKKGPVVPQVSDHISEENSPIITAYNKGLFDKAPARASFKAARKGKAKLVSAAAATVFETEIKGSFVKPPQHQ
jgi:hypothetical protein